MPIALDQTRREWELGYRRLQEEAREAPRGEAVLSELNAVTGTGTSWSRSSRFCAVITTSRSSLVPDS